MVVVVMVLAVVVVVVVMWVEKWIAMQNSSDMGPRTCMHNGSSSCRIPLVHLSRSYSIVSTLLLQLTL